MSIPSTALRALKRKQREGFHELGAAIESLEAEIRKSKASKRAVHAALPRPEVAGRTKAERKAEHAESTADLRSHVWERCGGDSIWDGDEHEGEWVLEGAGRCEVSGVELGAAWELHHLRGGGERRSAQSLDNVIAVSFDVHRLIHRGDLATLRDVKTACIRLGLRDGLRAIEHRIALAESAPTNKHRRTA